jgi:N-acetylmuramic acid 6-phosphate etherase
MIPATESTDPALEDLDSWPPGQILDALWQGQLAAVLALGPALSHLEQAAEAALPLLASGGRLVYVGAGTSGRIGVQDGAELNPTFNWPTEKLILLLAGGEAAFVNAVENAEDRGDLAREAIARHQIAASDVVIGIAASGATPYTLAAVEAARTAGALTIAIANSPGSALLAAAAHSILLETAPEPIAGSTRLKAGTAQKVALNLLSTLLMIRLGRVYRGQMVDMQARNEKLRRRAVRMVMQLGDCSEGAANIALAATGGQVKPALLVLQGLDAEAASASLARHGNSLRAALASLPPP